MDLPCFCAGRYLVFCTFFTTQGTETRFHCTRFRHPILWIESKKPSAIVAARFLDVLQTVVKLG